ncbi:AtpZ/AtpI family protein [Mameliella sp. MMSF_3455]|uniref:AtpZ/AtpI family protein n=1 Tax=Mameliella sp. MMSF_3455 TaxID=3046714 RepID=UPI003531937D
MPTLTGAICTVSDPDPKRKLDDLDAKLSAYKAGRKVEKAHQEEHYSQANIAWRMVTEMVAGLGIGFGIGYGLDALLGTTPLLMVVFSLLGIAAGINVMLRTAKEVQAKQGSGPQSGTGPERAKADRPDGGTNDSARLTGADEGKRDGD